MPNVQFGGLITGLDVNALVEGLAKAESRQIEVLQGQKVRYQAQGAVFTALVGALGGLKSAAQGLSLGSDFSKRAASSNNPTTVSASADATAQLGTSTIVVDTLAKAQSVRTTSTAFTSTTSNTLGTGTLTITVGGTTTNVTIDPTNNTLDGLKSAINGSGAAVTASIVNVGTSASPEYRLTVQSKNTGVANAVTVGGTLAGGLDPFPGGGAVAQAAADAVFSVDGQTLTRSSNTISDVTPGVTYTLLKEGDHNGVVDLADAAATASVTISTDSSTIKSSIKQLVDSYNAVNKIVNQQFTLDPNSKRQGSLAGDASLRGVMSRLRNEISAPGGVGVGVKYASDIGIKFQKDGSLTLDEAKLASVLASDPTGVSNLFTIVQNGIGKRIPDAVDDFASSVDGALIFRQKGIQTSIERIDKKVASEEIRIASLQERLFKQFSVLEQTVSQLKSQGDYLSQNLAGLSLNNRR